MTDFIEKTITDLLIIPKMVSFVFMLHLPFFKVLQDKMCCQNTKMASNKNVQNSAPRALKRTNCTINLQFLFTILVYIVSGDSLKVFFVTKFRVFHIYVSQNSM